MKKKWPAWRASITTNLIRGSERALRRGSGWVRRRCRTCLLSNSQDRGRKAGLSVARCCRVGIVRYSRIWTNNDLFKRKKRRRKRACTTRLKTSGFCLLKAWPKPSVTRFTSTTKTTKSRSTLWASKLMSMNSNWTAAKRGWNGSRRSQTSRTNPRWTTKIWRRKAW